MVGVEWTDLAQDLDQWWPVISTAMSLRGPKKKAENFLTR